MNDKQSPKDNFLVRLSTFFFSRWRLTLIAWLAFAIAAFVVYSQIIQREGFPAINFPITIINGTHFVDDVDQVDQDIAVPLATTLGQSELVKEVQIISEANFINAFVVFNNEVEASEGTAQIKTLIEDQASLPDQLDLNYTVVNPVSFLNEFEILLAVYAQPDTATEDLETVAQSVADQLRADPKIDRAEAQLLLQAAFNPSTQLTETRQIAFNQLGVSEAGQLNFYPTISVGLTRSDPAITDVVEFSSHVQTLIEALDLSQFDGQYKVKVTGDFAEAINSQIYSLESNLTSGLIAVMVVSLLLISWRASVITALFMVSVMLISILILYLLGISLNVISLFSLILALGLFVDDATIIVEVIEATRRRLKSTSQVIKESIRRVGLASLAGTLTTVLVFLPLLFVTGLLGEFIRIMPITIIVALLTSLLLSLIVIPLLSRFLLLRKRQPDWLSRVNPVAKAEAGTAKALANHLRLMRAKASFKNRFGGWLIIGFSFYMLVGALVFAGQVNFNIFPSGKDSNDVGITIEFPEHYSLEAAEATIDKVNEAISQSVADKARQVVYISSNQRQALGYLQLIDYSQRAETAPQITDRLKQQLAQKLDPAVKTSISLQGPGGPDSEFPFQVQIFEPDHQQAMALAQEINQHLQQAVIERPDGSTFEILETRLPTSDVRTRIDGQLAYILSARFEASDTSALLQLTQDYVTERFDAAYLTQAGYQADTLSFDFGMETDNAEAFASLGIIFPIVIVAIFILLVIQFRSWLQPLLILLAIPFTLFGVFAGLYYTNNPISFFSMLGLIGLIGIAVNNTILLTDYINQERRQQKDVIEAVAVATEKRFRPLVTTSLTTVVALLPLALLDPPSGRP